METEQDLIGFLTERVKARWHNEQPYYLSLIATDLRDQQIDYHAIIGEERLKTFVKRAAGDETFKVVEHPTQKAKVAIVPPTANYEFSTENAPVRTPIRTGIEQDDPLIVALFRALSRLPDHMLDEVDIPLKVLVRLAGRR